MKLLLIVPRYSLSNKPDYSYVLPIGFGYIFSVLEKGGHEVDSLNLNHFHGTAEQIITKKLDSKKYDFVCTGNNALGYKITELILKIARNHFSKPQTILGGPIITSEPELMLNELKPSIGVLGEGEETIIELLDAIEKKKSLKDVKGIIYKNKKNQVIKNPSREPIKDLDSIPFPNYEVFGAEEQLKNISTNQIFFTNLFDNTRVYPILASRSCPYQCTFCYHDNKYRKRSMDNVMEELEFAVKKYKINFLTIYDECFALEKDRLLDFCKRITRLRNEISWDLKWWCQFRVELVDDEILKTMKDAGCAIIGYGLESYSDAVLKSMKKHITPSQIDNALKKTFNAQIALQGFFIFGDTAETNETAKETLDYWRENCKGQVGLGFIQPYPGSEIYKRSLEKGVIKDRLAFIKDLTVWNWFNMTDKMTDKEVSKLKQTLLENVSKYTKFTEPLKIKKMRNGKYDFLVKCPFCNQTTSYKNCAINNKFTYGFNLICRKCSMRFFVISKIQKIAYANYSRVRALRDFEHFLLRIIRKKTL